MITMFNDKDKTKKEKKIAQGQQKEETNQNELDILFSDDDNELGNWWVIADEEDATRVEWQDALKVLVESGCCDSTILSDENNWED